MYNFDEVFSRRNTSASKYEALRGYENYEDIIPLSVADMDFKCPDSVRERIEKRLAHQVYSYTSPSDEAYEAVIKHVYKEHGYKIEKEWIIFIPGVVPALDLFVRSFVGNKENIIIQTPVYPPFHSLSNLKEMKILKNPLKNVNGRYEIDFKDLEEKAQDAKALILCSPHNPVGRVWTEDELSALAHIVKKHNLYLISDEIHADIVYKGYKHYPIASICKDIKDRTVTVMAPSKTYNIAGMNTSYAIVENEDMRNMLEDNLMKSKIGSVNVLGYEAMIGAYEGAADWKKELMIYLENNKNMILSDINKTNIIKVNDIEGTFLLWLDFSAVKKDNASIEKSLLKNGICLSNGINFGDERFFRMNIAYPRSVLKDAISRINKALDELI